MSFENLGAPADVVELAARLPQLAPDDPRLEGISSDFGFDILQYGENFYLLFNALSTGEDAPASIKRVMIEPAMNDPKMKSLIESGKLDKVIDFFRQPLWKDFYAVSDVWHDQSRRSTRPDIFGEPTPGLKQAIETAMGGLTGLSSAEALVWDSLNPLLIQAEQLMAEHGINQRY